VAGDPCGKWMPRAQTACARGGGHGGPCKSPKAMERMRQRTAARVLTHGRSVDPDVKRRWFQKNKLTRYGLTQELFDRLLEIQEYACAMCHTPFGEEKPIFIDHDHACCPDEKSSCGKCVRGLLCLSCNTALGAIERKYDLARAYLDNPPGHLVVRVEQAA
jgi:Recombination endonuclease VII